MGRHDLYKPLAFVQKSGALQKGPHSVAMRGIQMYTTAQTLDLESSCEFTRKIAESGSLSQQIFTRTIIPSGYLHAAKNFPALATAWEDGGPVLRAGKLRSSGWNGRGTSKRYKAPGTGNQNARGCGCHGLYPGGLSSRDQTCFPGFGFFLPRKVRILRLHFPTRVRLLYMLPYNGKESSHCTMREKKGWHSGMESFTCHHS